MAPTCQHIFCASCILRALELSPTCPIDRSALALEDLVKAPRLVQQLVQELKVTCPNKEAGCKIECERGLLEGHLRDSCTGVAASRDVKGKRKAKIEDAAAHDQEDVLCDLCEEIVISSRFSVSFLPVTTAVGAQLILHFTTQTHSSTCSAAPLVCPHCNTSLTRGLIPNHLLFCPSAPIPCPHARYGCPHRHPRFQMQEEHLDVSCAYEPLKDFLRRHETQLSRVEDENRVLQTRCEQLEDGMREMREMLDGVRMSLGELWVPPSSIRSRIEKRHVLTFKPEPRLAEVAVDDDPSLCFGDLYPPPSSPNTLRSPSLPPVTIPPTKSSPSQSPSFADDPPLPSWPNPLSFSAPVQSFPLPFPSSPSSSAKLGRSPPPSLPAILAEISKSIQDLSSNIVDLESRQNSNLMTETRLMQEDVQSIRGGLHGVRMAQHYLMMEVGRLTNGNIGGMAIGIGQRQDMGSSSHSDGAESNSDDDQPQQQGMAPRFRYYHPPPPMVAPGAMLPMSMQARSPPSFGAGGGMKL